MPSFPSVQFKTNKNTLQEDKEILRGFVKDKPFIHGRVIRHHKKLQAALLPKRGKVRWDAVNLYIDNYYQTHQQELVERQEAYEKEWQKIEDHFWRQLSPIFSHVFKKKYVAYVSIFSCDPLLTSTSFQIYWKYPPGRAMVITIHELIHLLFYSDTFNNRWDEIPDAWQKEESIIALSEAVNALFLNHSPLSNLTHKRDSYSQETSNILDKTRPLWPFTSSWSNNPQQRYILFLNEVWKLSFHIDSSDINGLAKMFTDT